MRFLGSIRPVVNPLTSDRVGRSIFLPADSPRVGFFKRAGSPQAASRQFKESIFAIEAVMAAGSDRVALVVMFSASKWLQFSFGDDELDRVFKKLTPVELILRPGPESNLSSVELTGKSGVGPELVDLLFYAPIVELTGMTKTGTRITHEEKPVALRLRPDGQILIRRR